MRILYNKTRFMSSILPVFLVTFTKIMVIPSNIAYKYSNVQRTANIQQSKHTTGL